MALSEFAAGGPSREQKSTVLREWGPEAWIPKQTDLISGLDKLTFDLEPESCLKGFNQECLQERHCKGIKVEQKKKFIWI